MDGEIGMQAPLSLITRCYYDPWGVEGDGATQKPYGFRAFFIIEHFDVSQSCRVVVADVH